MYRGRYSIKFLNFSWENRKNRKSWKLSIVDKILLLSFYLIMFVGTLNKLFSGFFTYRYFTNFYTKFSNRYKEREINLTSRRLVYLSFFIPIITTLRSELFYKRNDFNFAFIFTNCYLLAKSVATSINCSTSDYHSICVSSSFILLHLIDIKHNANYHHE